MKWCSERGGDDEDFSYLFPYFYAFEKCFSWLLLFISIWEWVFLIIFSCTSYSAYAKLQNSLDFSKAIFNLFYSHCIAEKSNFHSFNLYIKRDLNCAFSSSYLTFLSLGVESNKMSKQKKNLQCGIHKCLERSIYGMLSIERT